MTTTSSPAAVELRGVSKRFGEQRALDGVDLSIAAGRIHGLLGENGSGKSTIIKVLAGFYTPDEGSLLVHGRPVDLPVTAPTAAANGFQFVHQDLGLIVSMSVAENLALGGLVAKEIGPLLSDRRLRAQCRETLAAYGLELDPAAAVESLRPVERALLAIVRAIEAMRRTAAGPERPGLLVLDEPTVFLPRHDVERVFTLMRRLADDGHAVMLVSHDLDEVLEVTDAVTVLRDGKVAGSAVTSALTRAALVELIVGGAVDLGQTAGVASGSERPLALGVEGLAGGTLDLLDLELRAGEIVGLAGVAGAGFDEVPYLLTGARRASAGVLVSDDGRRRPAAAMTPRLARALHLGLIPADRRTNGGVAALDVVDNVTMLVLDRFRTWRGLDRRAMRRQTETLMDTFDVRPRDASHAFGTLSGGNQQKALLAKWLTARPRVLMIDEPTQGVDIGARRQIFDDLRRAAGEGAAVLVSSTDHEQLALLCDRVLVLQGGRLVRELHGPGLAKNVISEACMSASPEPTISAPISAPAVAGGSR